MITFVRLCNLFRPTFWAHSKQRKQLEVGLAVLLSCILFNGCTASVGSSSSKTQDLTGTLSASTALVAFGSVSVGQSASATVSVVNQGSAAVTIQFSPNATGAASGSLLITSDATTGGSLVVALSGTGTTASSSAPLNSL